MCILDIEACRPRLVIHEVENLLGQMKVSSVPMSGAVPAVVMVQNSLSRTQDCVCVFDLSTNNNGDAQASLRTR